MFINTVSICVCMCNSFNVHVACAVLNDGISLLFDLTWNGWPDGKGMSQAFGFPYFRIDTSSSHLVRFAENYVQNSQGTDAAFIFQSTQGKFTILIKISETE